jgi:exonuclease SbcC/exonuclease SbcD
MRIAHIADIHIGLGYPGPSPSSRFDDAVRILRHIEGVLTDRKVDALLFAGDAFKDANVHLSRARTEITAFWEFLNNVAERGIQAVCISGTPSHDSVDAWNIMRFFNANPDIQIFTHPGTARIEDGRGEAVSVAAVPGANRSKAAASEAAKNLSAREIHRLMSDSLTDVCQGLRVKMGEDYGDIPQILLSHYTYEGADTGFGAILQENEPILTAEAVRGYDLVCLGHIHIPGRVPGDAPVFYGGPPERYSFSDEKITPGFFIHEISGETGKSVESEFVPTPARKYVTVESDVSGYSGRIPPAAELDGAVVRVRIADTERNIAANRDASIYSGPLYERGAFFVQEVRFDAEDSGVSRVRSEEAAESLSPLQALRLWCAANGKEEEYGALGELAGGLLEEMEKGAFCK